MSGAAVSAAEVADTLQQLASRLAAAGHPMQAIKCHVAMLSQSMLPSDEAAARLRLGQLLMQHTLNVQDAKQHLQRAEMLVMPLPGQHLLKCEVLAGLASAHKVLGEVDFQRRCYNKGLELCKDKAAVSTDKRCLAEWAVYFHLHLAESLVAKGHPEDAVQQAKVAATVAGSQGLLLQQVLCELFQLQLAVMLYGKDDVKSLSSSIMQLLEQLEEQQEQQPSGSSSLAQLKLHLLMLQLMSSVQRGHFDLIQGEGKQQQKGQQDSSPQSPSTLEQMDELLQQLPDSTQHASTAAGQQQYDWLPPPVLTAAVQLVAALVDKNGGRDKPGLDRIAKGLQALDSHLAVLLQDKAVADVPAQSPGQQLLRACLALRIMLLETRQQLHLVCSEFEAARADAFDSIRVLNQFPKLLSGLEPLVHLQAGLYAHAVGSFAAAAQHFMAAANQAQQQGSLVVAADARHFAAICYVAQDTPESVKLAREVLGPISTEADASLGHSSRCLYHTAAGVLHLSGRNVGREERTDAKQQFTKALKIAHKYLYNRAVVSQMLVMMAPLQVAAADLAGAKQMVSSCVQLSHASGDLHTQVSAMQLLQGLLSSNEEAANNTNYVARKQEELSSRMQAAESNAQQHHAVLTWGLN